MPMVAICLIPLISRAATIATSMAVDRPEAIDPHPEGAGTSVEGGRERLSCLARNGRETRGPRATSRAGWFGQGKKVETGGCGKRARPSAARSAFGQTSHIEDAVGRARRRNNRNKDGCPFIGITARIPLRREARHSHPGLPS